MRFLRYLWGWWGSAAWPDGPVRIFAQIDATARPVATVDADRTIAQIDATARELEAIPS